MKLVVFIVVVGIIAAINNLIGIIINGPTAFEKVAPFGSWLLQRASNPIATFTLVMVGMFAFATLLSALVGPPEPNLVIGPDGRVVIDPTSFLLR